MSAPVCPISTSQAPPSQPGIALPPVPKAQDLPSAIQAINVLTQIINYLTMPSLPSNNLVLNFTTLPPLVKPATAAVALQPPKPQAARFVEAGRSQETVKVVNPNDDSQFVIVKRVNSITFKDRITGSLLIWSR
jgi:hypothetical protein